MRRLTRTLAIVLLGILGSLTPEYAQSDEEFPRLIDYWKPRLSSAGLIEGFITSGPAGGGQNQPGLNFLELGVGGELSDFARVDITTLFVGQQQPFATLDEGYLSLPRLLGIWGMKAGYVRAPWGAVNRLHQHDLPFVGQPLMLTVPFGTTLFSGSAVTVYQTRVDKEQWSPEFEFAVMQAGLRPFDTFNGNSIGILSIHQTWALNQMETFRSGVSYAIGENGSLRTSRIVSGQNTWEQIGPNDRRGITHLELSLCDYQYTLDTVRSLNALFYWSMRPNRYHELGVLYDRGEHPFTQSVQSRVGGFLTYRPYRDAWMRGQIQSVTTLTRQEFQILAQIGFATH